MKFKTFVELLIYAHERIIGTLIRPGPCKSVYVKFLNFRTPENFALIHLKLKQRRQILEYFGQKDTNGIANSEDPDQTAPLGAV